MATYEKIKLAVVYHPGRMLAEKLEEMAMNVKEFAVRISKPEEAVLAIIDGVSPVTSDMAEAFESVTRIPAHFWLNKQRSYDEYVLRKKREALKTKSAMWANKFGSPSV